MKKMTILAVILALAIALTACSGEKAPETTAATAPVSQTAAAEAAPSQPVTLADWSMHASTWSSPNGATIHITATPSYYEEGQKADFVVRLEGEEISGVPCQWDGTSYTASADLNAANGYSYYVVFTAADGVPYEAAVNTTEEPAIEAFVNMETALTSYCSITVEESAFEDSKLTLTGGKVLVQAPVITNEGEVITCQEAVLVLRSAGEELAREVLTLTQTDTEGLYEAALDSVVFEIPEIPEDQSVELSLNATLTNGQALSAYGGNWFNSAEGFMPIVG